MNTIVLTTILQGFSSREVVLKFVLSPGQPSRHAKHLPASYKSFFTFLEGPLKEERRKDFHGTKRLVLRLYGVARESASDVSDA